MINKSRINRKKSPAEVVINNINKIPLELISLSCLDEVVCGGFWSYDWYDQGGSGNDYRLSIH